MDELCSFLAAIVESSDDAIIGLDSYGQILSWNRGARQIYGYNAAEVAGRPISILSLPERGDEILKMQQSLQTGRPIFHLQTIHLNKDGHSIFVSLAVSPVRDRREILIGASLIVRDITRQLQAEEALRDAEEKYRQLFHAEQDAIILFEEQNETICDANAAALQLYRYPKKEFLQLKIDDLISTAEPAWRTAELSTARHCCKDGHRFDAETSLGRFSMKGRGFQVMIVRDISERRQHEKLRQSLALAKEFQQRLLPTEAPQLPGYDIHVQTRYCQEAGGDYYDFFTTPEATGASLAFAVGDVSGHSVGAALLMALTKGILQNEARHCLLDQDSLLRSLNCQLFDNTDDSNFMTLFLGRIDTARQQLYWNSAGHGPVFCYRRHQERFIELPPSDIPLGIDPRACYPNPAPQPLASGDILLIGTDGLWETRNPLGEMYGSERLKQIIATHREKSAATIHAIVMQKITDFHRNPEREDDMTLMVIKITG